MPCDTLTRLSLINDTELHRLSRRFVTLAQYQAFWTEHDAADRETWRPKLERLTYFAVGSRWAAKKEFNEMTRMQLEHELRRRGKLEDGEELTDWGLRLRMAAAIHEEKGEVRVKVEEEEEGEVRAKVEGEDEQHGDDEEEEEEKVILTRNNGQVMVF